MKKLNFDYTLYDVSGAILKSGHINYSISHFIYALYQKIYAYQKKQIPPYIPTPQDFWDSFRKALDEKQTGNVFFAFANNQPQFLNRSTRVGILRIMQSFGYFAMHDITGTYPIFNKVNGRVFLEDTCSNYGMSFHFNNPAKSPKHSYSKLFMSTFDTPNNGNMSLVNQQNTFKLKIIDPVGSGQKNDEAIREYLGNKRIILDDLQATKEFYVNFDFASFKVSVSKTPIYELNDKLDSFTDNEIYIYVEELLKVSEYIHFIDDERLALSLRTASLVKLEDPKYNSLKAGLITDFNDDEIIKLKEMGFVVKIGDEYEDLQRKRNANYRKPKNSFGLTILTTTKCNARCHYCYEKGIKKETLSLATQKRIAEIAIEQSKLNKKIHISWFGGEPLLNVPAIKNISKILEDNNVGFSTSMISNGYLVDQYIETIESCRIKSIQITLDGVENKYNDIKQFVYKNENAFERVIDNIKLLLSKDIRVNIRLNFNRDNYQGILECIDFINETFGNNEKLGVYASHIFGDSLSYHLDDGTNIYYLIFKKLIDCGFVKNLVDLGIKERVFYCFVTDLDNRVINANGDYYICEHAVSNSKAGRVGNVFSGIAKNSNYKFWTSIGYPNEQCKKCKYLFVCQGGCKSANIENGEFSSCLPYIDAIDDIIKYYYKKRRS